MSDLTDFLLARIAEDEAAARAAQRNVEAVPAGATIFHRADLEHIARHDPARVLAECAAKRRIIEAAWADHLQIEGEWGHGRGREELSRLNDYPEVVLLLALPYADHPDYDPAWRP